MRTWHWIFLLAAVGAGWVAYPGIYPVISEFVTGVSPTAEKTEQEKAAVDDLLPMADFDDEMPSAPEIDESILDAIVSIRGNRTQGTGFIIKQNDKLFIVTNQRVLSGNSKLKISDRTGIRFRGTRMLAARNADIAMIELTAARTDQPYLQLMSIDAEPASKVDALDEIVVAGDSQGTGTMIITPGTIRCIGGDEIVFEGALFDGDSGGPIYHIPSKRVIGVVTQTRTLQMDPITEENLKTGDPAFDLESTFFGQRIDTVRDWQKLDWSDFQKTSELIHAAWRENVMLHTYMFSEARAGSFSSHEELVRVHNAAVEQLGRPRMSAKDRTKTVQSLSNTIRSMATKRLRQLKNYPLYYVHRGEQRNLDEFSRHFTSGVAIAEKQFELVAKRVGT